jgi:hypothetical protein
MSDPADLFSDDTDEASMIYECSECNKLLTFFFGTGVLERLETLLPKDIRRNSTEDAMFRFGYFLDRLFKTYNKFAADSDFLNLYVYMTKKLKMDAMWKMGDKPPRGRLFHTCRVLMSSLSGIRLGITEGNHRLLSMLLALYNLCLSDNIDQITGPEFNQIIKTEDLGDDQNKLQASKLCALAPLGLALTLTLTLTLSLNINIT